MIDRIEMILNDIKNELKHIDDNSYRGSLFSVDEWHFIQKCLTNYQMILVKEINKND